MNTNDFKNLNYITLNWELLEDYRVLKKGSFRLPPIKLYESTVFDMDITYTFTMDGNIITDIHAVPYGKFTEVLPRIGVCFTMDKDFDNVVWYGRGEDENCCDRKAHCNFGIYRKKVEDMNFIYDIPQECGTRIENSFVLLKAKNRGFSIIGSERFAFSYHDFTLDSLISARHRNELKKSDENYLHIDYSMRGPGSHSCGHNPEECYELRGYEFRFVFVISTETEEEKQHELSRKDFGKKTEKPSGTHIYEEKEQQVNYIECNINKD